MLLIAFSILIIDTLPVLSALGREGRDGAGREGGAF